MHHVVHRERDVLDPRRSCDHPRTQRRIAVRKADTFVRCSPDGTAARRSAATVPAPPLRPPPPQLPTRSRSQIGGMSERAGRSSSEGMASISTELRVHNWGVMLPVLPAAMPCISDDRSNRSSFDRHSDLQLLKRGLAAQAAAGLPTPRLSPSLQRSYTLLRSRIHTGLRAWGRTGVWVGWSRGDQCMRTGPLGSSEVLKPTDLSRRPCCCICTRWSPCRSTSRL